MSVEIKPLGAAEFRDDEIRSLLVASVYNPTAERVATYVSRATSSKAVAYAAYDAGIASGLVVFENVGGSNFAVVTIFVDPRSRGHGVGRYRCVYDHGQWEPVDPCEERFIRMGIIRHSRTRTPASAGRGVS